MVSRRTIVVVGAVFVVVLHGARTIVGCSADPTEYRGASVDASGMSEPDSGTGMDASEIRDAADASTACVSTFAVTPDCKHPPVEARCREGFCEIPPGCFVLGSPECQPGRGARTETEAQVTLTHRFEIGQHEVTQGEWVAAGFVNSATAPIGDAGLVYGSCLAPDCPATNLSWFDAVAYANYQSRRHSPPLPECYTLESCIGALGAGSKCSGVRSAFANVYECPGYRLPTEAEWEYAARAGSRTPYYTGPMLATSFDPTKECREQAEPNLDRAAWYCATATLSSPSRIETRPVMLKEPNGWGLFDMLGNVAEWTSDEYMGLAFRDGPYTNPGASLGASNQRTKRGLGASSTAIATTVSRRLGATWDLVQDQGVRLARTLPLR